VVHRLEVDHLPRANGPKTNLLETSVS
jgi:hypothetical protein